MVYHLYKSVQFFLHFQLITDLWGHYFLKCLLNINNDSKSDFKVADEVNMWMRDPDIVHEF